jgi:xylulokinase
MGRVSEGAGRRYGLPTGIPVTIAGHDHLAAAAGLGAGADDLLNSVGTAETLVRRLGTAPDVERALELELAVTLWPGGDGWAVLASATRAGLVIEALTAHLGLDPDALDRLVGTGEGGGRRPPRNRGGTDERCGAEGPPRQAAERSGVDEGGAPGRAAEIVALGQGIDVPVSAAGEMWTATLSALARRTAAAAERVAALAGPHRRLVVFGGGSRSPAWLRAKAAEVGTPVLCCPVPEAAARGAALAAGVAGGWWPSVAAGPSPALDAAPEPA